jgi:hypothetical protein
MQHRTKIQSVILMNWFRIHVRAAAARAYLGEDAPDDVLGARRRGEGPDVSVVSVGVQPQRPQAHHAGGHRGALLGVAALGVQRRELVLYLRSMNKTKQAQI